MMYSKKVAVAVSVLVAVLAFTGCARKSTKTAGGAASGLQRVHFDFDKYSIKSEYEGTLKSNAGWLQNSKKAVVVIEGHCDERGTAEYNIALGDRRAKSAKNYLTNLGIDDKRLSTISYGEEKPLASCHEESCWWQNRRADFISK
ncbi:MAG: peptidoglycan-associated lipoprotein Pal [Deltaproteobacteria bacterium]|nr:peptidoglycan-associated lipoprotein Pal [Deltaproteobacteria bacterium]